MAARRYVFHQERFFADWSQKDIASSITGKIRHHTTGVALDSDGEKKISGINLQCVDETVSRPIVNKQCRTPAAVTPESVGNQNIQIAVIVHICKLSTGSTEPAAALRKALVTRKTEPTLIHKKLQSFIGKNQKIAVAILVRVPGSGTENAFHRKAGRFGVEYPIFPGAVVHPADRLSATCGKDHQIQVTVIIKIVIHHGGNGNFLKREAKLFGNISKRTVPVVVIKAAGRGLERHPPSCFRKKAGGNPSACKAKCQKIQVTVAINIKDSRTVSNQIPTGNYSVLDFSEIPLSIIFKINVRARAAEPEVKVPVIIHITEAGRDTLLRQSYIV
ncbi:hypothetical protein ES703_58261 [subsurface metagenome]